MNKHDFLDRVFGVLWSYVVVAFAFGWGAGVLFTFILLK